MTRLWPLASECKLNQIAIVDSQLGELMSLRTVIKSALDVSTIFLLVNLGSPFLVCIVIAALNALAFAYRIGYLVADNACSYSGPLVRDNSYDFMRLKIEVALVVIAIALRFRTILGFYISLLATVLIEIQFALWYLDTQRWLRDVKVTDFSKLEPGLVPHFAGIYQATPWDFVLFVFTSALLVWQVRVLIALITSTRRNK